MVLPKSSSVGDLDAQQLQRALGIDPDAILADLDGELVPDDVGSGDATDDGAGSGAEPSGGANGDGGSGGIHPEEREGASV
jgi:hypothetical protein